MKKALLFCFLPLLSFSQALEKGQTMIDLGYGLNNQFATELDAEADFSAGSELNPINLGLEYALTDRLTLGLQTNFSETGFTYINGGLYFGDVTVITTMVTGNYYYVNSDFWLLGSGLAVGYKSADAEIEGVTFSDTGFAFDVNLVYTRIFLGDHFNLNGKLYLLDGFNQVAALGVGVKL